MVAPLVLGSLIGGGATIGSTILGGLFSKSNARDQYLRTQESVDRQFDLNKRAYQNRYQWTVGDMVKAGINPIMAASGGFNVGQAPASSLPNIAKADMPAIPDFASSAKDVMSAYETSANVGKIKAERMKALKEAELAGKKALETVQRTAKIRVEQNLIGAQERRTIAEIVKTYKDVNRIASQTALMENQIDELQVRMGKEKEETENIKEQRGLIQRNKERASQEIKRLRFLLSQLGKVSNVYKSPIGGFLTYLREIISALGLAPIAGALLTKGKK